MGVAGKATEPASQLSSHSLRHSKVKTSACDTRDSIKEFSVECFYRHGNRFIGTFDRRASLQEKILYFDKYITDIGLEKMGIATKSTSQWWDRRDLEKQCGAMISFMLLRESKQSAKDGDLQMRSYSLDSQINL